MSLSIKTLFNIKYPIVQGGMVWCSGWELASAVSNAGGLGLIGSGSMPPNILRVHIQKTKAATQNPFGVNVPLLYQHINESIQVIIDEKVPIVFTSAGNPATYTAKLKEHGVIVVHVVSNLKFALKAQAAGVHAIVAEGVEAGGHNGKEETTTLTLIPLIKQHVNISVIAAGGIATGRGMLAALALGANGVQIGTRFIATTECSAHQNFKQAIINATDGSTRLAMRKLNPVRLLQNNFSLQLAEAENNNASPNTLKEILGKGRSKKGMFEGELDEGELEAGQIAAIINNIKPAAQVINEIIEEYNKAVAKLGRFGS